MINVRSPGAVVKVTGTTFATWYNPKKKETSVGVLEGTVGVQLLRSDIGEVMVNRHEKVTVSSEKEKVLQDELMEMARVKLAECQ